MNTLVQPSLRGLGNFAIAARRVKDALEAVERTDAAGDDCRVGWRVVLYNDRFNRRKRVTTALTQLAGLDGAEADAAMMAAHTSGRAVVKSFQGGATARELAEAMHAQLAAADLLVEVERI